MNFKIIITRLQLVFINLNRNHYNQHIFYQWEISLFFFIALKSVLWDSANSRKAFSASWWLRKHFSLQNLVQMLQEVAVGWWEVMWIWQIRQNFVAQLVQLLKNWCATCSQALSWRRTVPYLLTIVVCRHCNFQCISLICWAYFSDIMVSPEFRKL